MGKLAIASLNIKQKSTSVQDKALIEQQID